LLPVIFIVCQVLIIQYSQSQSIICATKDIELLAPKIEVPVSEAEEIPEEDNGEELEEDESSEQIDENKTKGLILELEKLEDVKNPVEKFTLLTESFEEQGKLPPRTTELLRSVLDGDTKAIAELCDILSKDQSTTQVDCATIPDQTNDTQGDIVEYGHIIAQIAIQILEATKAK
jgi:hypothetical protein